MQKLESSNMCNSHTIIVRYKGTTVGHVHGVLAQKLVPLLENSMIVCMEAVVKGEPRDALKENGR